jgi:hypothetical protein
VLEANNAGRELNTTSAMRQKKGRGTYIPYAIRLISVPALPNAGEATYCPPAFGISARSTIVWAERTVVVDDDRDGLRGGLAACDWGCWGYVRGRARP